MEHNYEFIEPPTSDLISELMKKQADPKVYAEWLLLFDEYNKATNSRKGMGCRPCYGIVYSWYKKELYKQNFHNDQSRENDRLDEQT